MTICCLPGASVTDIFCPMKYNGQSESKTSVIPVVLPDMVLSHHAEPHYEPAAPACREAMTCEVTVGGASLRLSGDLSPALLKTLIRELSGRSR
ncbi:hypothetical protein [Enterobacter hormaechei]